MTRLPLIAKRAEELLGASVISTAPVAGGGGTATPDAAQRRHHGPDEAHHQAPDGFFDAEVRGLRWLGEAAAEGGSRSPRCSPTTTSA